MQQIPDAVADIALIIGLAAGRLAERMMSFESGISLFSLGSAFAIAAGFLILRRTRPVRIRALVRALLPRRWWAHPSSRADFAWCVFNVLFGTLVFGWAIVSSTAVEAQVAEGLARMFGPGSAARAATLGDGVLFTIALFLAYETAYFVDHYLSHKLPLLWHFHRVHHSAEVLTPITNFRVHPVDTIVFLSIVALFTGFIAAGLRYALGVTAGPVTIGGANAILVASHYVLTHLHHSEVWIAFTGRLGRVVLSPAHHQIHHSTDPRHYDRNFGNVLAVFDRLAGTLHVPTAAREKLEFGAGPFAYDPHGVSGTLLMPFADAAGTVAAAARPVRRSTTRPA